MQIRLFKKIKHKISHLNNVIEKTKDEELKKELIKRREQYSDLKKGWYWLD